MHFDFTIHFWPAVGYLGSLATAITFLRKVVREITELKKAAITLLDEHHEVYGWYSKHVKTKLTELKETTS